MDKFETREDNTKITLGISCSTNSLRFVGHKLTLLNYLADGVKLQ